MVLLVDFTIAVFEKTLIKGTVSGDGYFLGKLYTFQSVFSVYALMVFKVFQKFFTTLYNYYIFICFFEIIYKL
jgi:hypothetical protein